MADEIAQVCDLEIRGITLAVKGSVQTARWVMQAIKALLELGGKGVEWSREQAGSKSMQDVWKLSKDEPPQVIMVPEKVQEGILESMKKAGLRYHTLPDLDPVDGKVPICLPPQDVALASAIVKSYLENMLSESEKDIQHYEDQIAEEKEKLVSGIEEAGSREEIETKIEQLEQGREEALDSANDIRESIETGAVVSFQDYLRQGKGTEFEADPDKAISELEKGVEIGPSFSAQECLQPIRDQSLMPESKLRFYVPETGVTITREFETNKDTGLVVSTYRLKTEEGVVHEFSDADVSKAEWNASVLPDLLDKAGIMEQTKCRVFDTEEKLTAYQTYYGQVKTKAEEHMEGAIQSDTKGFSDADVLAEARNAVTEQRKGEISANPDRDRVRFTFPQGSFQMEDGMLTCRMEDGSRLKFSDVRPEVINGTEMTFSVHKDDSVMHEYTLSGREQAISEDDRQMVSVTAGKARSIAESSRQTQNMQAARQEQQKGGR